MFLQNDQMKYFVWLGCSVCYECIAVLIVWCDEFILK